MWGGPSGQTDTWAGYQAERRAILDLLYYIPNVIIISGDRHEFAAIEHFGGILEFSTSPLNQFYFPLVRTLKQKLAKVREVKVGSGEEVKILKVPEEKILKYIAVGNHKW
jgi:alkaline phosphatase D